MNSLTYTLVVNGANYGDQSSRSAYKFASALLAKGHQLNSVFFYRDGVTNGGQLAVPANDEFDITAAWQALSQQHGFALQTCVAAALRRGIVSESEAQQHGLASHNLADGFEQSGLGSLAEALLSQDRVVQF